MALATWGSYFFFSSIHNMNINVIALTPLFLKVISNLNISNISKKMCI